MIALGQFLFRFRNGIFPLAMVAALMLARPEYSFGHLSADLVTDLIGIALVIAGQALRMLTIGYDYIRRGGREGRVYADGLVEGGVFAHCRNPLYLGNILMAAGFLTIIGHGGLLAAGVPLVALVYAAIVAAEEDYLTKRFGERYADYCARVNRWIPDWSGLSASIGAMRFDWRRVVVKEYNTLFGVLSGLLVVQTWTRVVEQDLTQTRLVWTLAAAGALIAAYLLVRRLKKTRALYR